MRAVVQRVSSASVSVDGEVLCCIGEGLLVYLGVQDTDDGKDVSYLASKVGGLRIFEDEAGAMNRSAGQVGARILVISQFTLLGDCRRGKRPSFTQAMAPQPARALYESFVETLRADGFDVVTGRFQALMDVESVNHGPVTILLDSTKNF